MLSKESNDLGELINREPVPIGENLTYTEALLYCEKHKSRLPKSKIIQ